MKTPGLLLALLLGCAASLRAQITNGVTTSAERQALYDARTAAQQRSQAAGSSSSSSSSSGSSSRSSSGPSMSEQEYNAYLRKQFGIKSEEEKASEERQAQQKRLAAREAEQRKQEQLRAEMAASQRQWEARQQALSQQMQPWLSLGFASGDAQALADKALPHSYGQPTDPALFDRLRAARQAFQELYGQPNATYEALRQVARQLPVFESQGNNQLGVGTALEQYARLLRRFPAHQGPAALDVLQAGQTYLAPGQEWQFWLAPKEFHRRLVQLLQEAAAVASPVQGQQVAAQLAPGGIFLAGRPAYAADTLLTLPLLRLSYRATHQYLRTGQAAASGLSETQLQTNAGNLALYLGAKMTDFDQPRQACYWLLEALAAHPGALDAAATEFARLLTQSPAAWAALQPADWQRLAPAIGLTGPLQVQAVQSWLADSVRLPDHPRWQTLSAGQRASLAQAQALGNWLRTKAPNAAFPDRQLLATWNYLLSPPESALARQAKDDWQWACERGSVPAARNLYRALLLDTHKPLYTKENGLFAPLYRLAQYQQKTDHGQGKYLAALLLLDELPGYPPLGKSDKKEGRRWLKEAAAAGSPAAAARLERGF